VIDNNQLSAIHISTKLKGDSDIMSDQTPSEARLAFVDISVFDDGSIRGGVLITDMETRPYEFRVTTPVKPTSMQRVLYGKTLSEYVYGELIAFPLVKAVKEKISLVVTKNENLLIMRPKISIPVVVINRDSGGISQGKSGEKIGMITYRSHPSYAGEGDWSKTILNDLVGRHDPFEPFERLKIAMDEVHKQKIGEK
jgi:hypothetical protein